MEIPEIQYQPQAPSAPFQPVEQVDITRGLEANHRTMMAGMEQNLAQMRADKSTAVQNARNSIPVEELSQFSSTLKKYFAEKKEFQRKEDQAEGAWLALSEGFEQDPDFDEQEKRLESEGAAIQSTGDDYERRTGDTEGGERIRGMSAAKKYGYWKAKMQMVGDGFGAFAEANAANAQYGFNGHTLSTAPDSATRQAIIAKMSTSYLKPYAGLNKSFLGKYLFPGMRQGMVSASRSSAAANAKRIKANRIDAAQTQFLSAADVGESMQNFRRELTAMGHTEADIRSKMVEMAGQFQSRSQLDSFLNAQYGPNGKSFREQYPKEAQQAVNSFNSLKTSHATNASKEREIADLNAKEEAMQAVLSDREDGSFDANPERLKQLADQARASGLEKTAKFWESQIEETAVMKNSSTIVEQYKKQIQAGIIPSKEEILQNPGLSQKDKDSLLKSTQGSGKAEPGSDIAKGHKKILEAAVRKRGKWSPTKANDPGVAAMELKAWQEYKEVYNRELQANGGDESAAANAALSDFKSKFGTDEYQGEYRLYGTDDGKVSPDRLNTYAGYDPEGQASSAVVPLQQFDQEAKEFGGANNAINHAVELYDGEKQQLKSLVDTFKTTGTIGTVPPLYYQLQQRYGGNVSISELINKRLEAAGLEGLPTELNDILKPVEDSFDDDTYKYISYKPNTTRTDVGVINGGGDAVYAESSAAQEEIKAIFGQRESPAAGYDAMNRGKGGDSPGGGTRQLGRDLRTMTVGEIKQLQATGGVNAVGRYQFIKGTLIEAADAAGITDDMLFNEAVQDRMFFVHLDRYGAHGPWEQWWIQQGGEHLRLTPVEKQKIEAFRESYDPSKPWRQARNTRAELLHVYTSGNIGPTSTGPHLDVKQVGGGRFEETALDDYVVVHDRDYGDVSLGQIRQKTGGIGDDFDDHVARGSHGIDYGLHSGTKISLKGGAKVIRTVASAHGDVLTIQVPDGRQFTFLHGTSS